MNNTLEKRIGIIGGGQLGKMMILEAKRLGVYVVTLDPAGDCPSHSISDEHIIADFHDEKAIRELAEKVDVITYEFEHINAVVLGQLEREGHTVYPSVASLTTIQDKYLQKMKLREGGVKVPDFSLNLEEFGYPYMLKSRKDGYDGKGNQVVHEGDAITLNGDLMAEELINFDKEVSIIATREIDGEAVVYPLAYNVHKNSILDTTTVTDEVHQRAYDIAVKVMDIFDGVGTFCVEMFLVGDDIYVNEVAPRPHNSGHYTIEGCRTNQFENHIRAVLGLPLGDTRLLHGAVIMRNLLGEESDGAACVSGVEEACAIPGVHLHIYGKKESKIGRKMGHYTVTADTLNEAREKDEKIKDIVKIINK